MEVVVAGTGYVGLVTGVCLANMNHNVTCVDIDEEKIKKLNKGISPIYEDGLEELMLKNKDRLTYTTNRKNAYKKADVIFVGVNTPEREDGSANLDYVYNVIDEIIDSLVKDTVVVIKSTVPIQTNDKIDKIFKEKLKNINVSVVSNPEFLAQGTSIKDTLYASRIIVGVEDDYSREIMRELYKPFTEEPYNVPYVEMDRKSAEMVKYASNNFLALKISFINEVANLCGKLGANIENVTKGMSYDKRIGNKFLNAGIGYGGSCFPKDTMALYHLSKELNSEMLTIKSCTEVNKKQTLKLLEYLNNDFKNLDSIKIAILGLTFKPGTDDVRNAASFDNVKILLEKGAVINAYDPVGINNFKKLISVNKLDDSKINYFDNIEDAITGVDAALIMTEWPIIKNFDITKYETLMNEPYVYDGRNCYSLKNVKKTNIKYKSIGR